MVDGRWEPRTMSYDDDEYIHLQQRFATIAARYRNRPVKTKLEAPCGQEWQALLDCYLDYGAHPALCYNEEIAMHKCKQNLVRWPFYFYFYFSFLFLLVSLVLHEQPVNYSIQPQKEQEVKAQNFVMTGLVKGLRIK